MSNTQDLTTGSYEFPDPKRTQYTFWIAGFDSSGNYSEPQSITMTWPGYQKITTPVVESYFQSIRVHFPKGVFDLQGNPRTYLGYRLFLTPVNEDSEPIGPTEEEDYFAQTVAIIQAESGERYKIELAVFDTVVLAKPELFADIKSDPVFVEVSFIPPEIIGRSNLIEELQADLEVYDGHQAALDEAQGRLDAAEGRLDGVEGRVTTAEADIILLEDQIILKASQEDLDAVEGRVTDNEAELIVQASQIAARVTKTEFDLLEGRVTDNEAALIVQYDMIQARVTYQDFDTLEGRVNFAESTLTQHANQIAAKVEQSEFDELEGTVSGYATQMDILADSFMVRIQSFDEEGVRAAAGFGLALNEEDESEFVVLADNFKVFLPEIGIEEAVFGIGTVDGEPAVGIKADMFLDGSMKARMIEVEELNVLGVLRGMTDSFHSTSDTFYVSDIMSTYVAIPNLELEINAQENGKILYNVVCNVLAAEAKASGVPAIWNKMRVRVWDKNNNVVSTSIAYDATTIYQTIVYPRKLEFIISNLTGNNITSVTAANSPYKITVEIAVNMLGYEDTPGWMVMFPSITAQVIY